MGEAKRGGIKDDFSLFPLICNQRKAAAGQCAGKQAFCPPDLESRQSKAGEPVRSLIRLIAGRPEMCSGRLAFLV